ncbi:medium-chain acyl-CoA ligase ACSF2, mitochondrial-like [Tachypleus tridentatus]|uniref:medium-chain acyl-CoA ligase ACSF2, mitochondrial-like n=1 Tax=Tachypleus tridentatus TaxID=6853 RepID=UPI003FD38EE6
MYFRTTDQLAASFLELGLRPGERLAIWSTNCYEWVLTQLAAAKAGLVLVNINPAFMPSELEYCFNLMSRFTHSCHVDKEGLSRSLQV